MRAALALSLALARPALAGSPAERPPEPEAAPPRLEVETLNHTPFATGLMQSEVEGRAFFTAVIKVTLKVFPSGELKFASEQEPISDAVVFHPRCPGLALSVNDVVAFRRQAEIFLDPGPLRFRAGATVAVDGERRAIRREGECALLSTPEDLFLRPYLTEGSTVAVRGIEGAEDVTYVVPEGFFPFVLVRYHMGAMQPTPARLDTVIVRPEAKRLVLVYRSTFWAEPPVRKLEYRAVLQPRMGQPSKGETPEAFRRRSEAMRRHLRECPPPDGPGEPCADHRRPPSPALFSAPR
jgi:hypothetical protein